MEKTDLLEIKKLFRYPNCSFKGMGFAVVSSLDHEGQEAAERIAYTGENLFLTRDDEEQKSFLSLLQKAYCFQEGVSSLDVPVVGDLKRILSSYAFDDNVSHNFDLFSRLIAEKYDYPKSYALVYFMGSYDIPEKDTSKTKTGESEEVYSYVAVMLCPIEVSKVGLTPKDGDIKRGDIVRILKQPNFGLIYPSFTERSSDSEHAFVCCRKEAERDLVSQLFNEDVPEPPKKEKAKILNPAVYTGDVESEGVSTAPLNTPAAPLPDDTGASSDDYKPHEEGYVSASKQRYDEEIPLVNDIDSALLRKRNENNEKDETFEQDIQVKEDKSVVSNIRVTERDIGGKKFFIIPRDLLPDDILEKILSLGE